MHDGSLQASNGKLEISTATHATGVISDGRNPFLDCDY